MTIDDVLGTRQPLTVGEARRTIALHLALAEAFAVATTPIPSGTLYAIVMASGYTLEEYERAIEIMIEAGRLRRSEINRDLLEVVP